MNTCKEGSPGYTRPNFGMRLQGGFSVVEILVVMAILGVLMTIGLGYFRSDRIAVGQAAQGLAAQINRTRLEAIRQNRYAGICFTTTGGGAYSVRVSDSPDTVCPSGTLVQTVQFGQGDLGNVKLGTQTVSGTFVGIIFDSRGMPSGNIGGTFPVTNKAGTYSKQVVVSAQGKGSVQ